MPVSLAALPKGFEFPCVTFELSPEWMEQYVAAVGDDAIGRLDSGVVSPMSLAALASRALLENADLPPGTLHAGQELQFRRAVRTGESLAVGARIASRGERAGWVLMSVDLEAADAAGRAVMSGRATISFPVEADG